MPDSSTLRGILFMLCASILFACMGGSVKLLDRAYSPLHIALFRSLIGLLPILYSLYTRPAIKTKKSAPLLLAFRGIIGTFTLLLLFYNLATLTLAETITYIQSAPFFIAIFSYFFLGQKLSKIGWLAVIMGFLGVVLITRPNSNQTSIPITGILSSLMTALAYTSISKLKQMYDTRIIVLSFLFWGSLLPLFFIILPFPEIIFIRNIYYPLPEFELWSGIYLILVGLFALGGQLFLTKAYGEAKAAILGVIGYFNIVFSLGLGVLLGDRWPDKQQALGMIIIIISGILISKEKSSPT